MYQALLDLQKNAQALSVIIYYIAKHNFHVECRIKVLLHLVVQVAHFHHTSVISVLKNRAQMPVLPYVREPLPSLKILFVSNLRDFFCSVFR